jgi:hypothetical protein
MSGLFRNYKTDADKESTGIEVPFPDAQNDDGTIPTFILARMGGSNAAYQKALEAATRPHRRQIALNALKEEIANELLLGVFATTVLLGWRNVQDAKGGDLIYGRKEAVELMKTLPDLYARLRDEATVAANYRDESLEAQAKN